MNTALAVPVLMYHHVSPAAGAVTVSPVHFADQMAMLAREGYTTLSARAFSEYLAGKPVPAKSVVLTFDDGYLDNWVHAHPVLAEHGFTALGFLVSGWVNSGPVRPNAADPVTSTSARNLPDLLGHSAAKAAIEAGEARACATTCCRHGRRSPSTLGAYRIIFAGRKAISMRTTWKKRTRRVFAICTPLNPAPISVTAIRRASYGWTCATSRPRG
jgi:hypothetical protein